MKAFHILILFIISNLSLNGQTNMQLINSSDGYKNIYEILSTYIQIKSESGKEKNAGLYFRNLCEANRLNIYPMGETDGNFNFAASLFPLESKKPNIILLNHIDTVSEGPLEKWQYSPYSGEITEKDVWGRGAFDNKGAAVMQLFSLLNIKETIGNFTAKYNITLLSVSCEETQCPGGISFVIDNYLDLLNPVLVLGEGPPALKNIVSTNPELEIFGISVAQKRPLWLELELEVKSSGHGAVPPHHYANKDMVLALDNVLNKKAKIIYDDLNVSLLKQLGELEKGIKKTVLKHPRLFKFIVKSEIRKTPELLALFTNTISLTRIHNNNQTINNIPQNVKAYLDCRLLVGQDESLFLEDLKTKLNNPNINISILNQTPTYLPTEISNTFYKNLEAAIIKNFPNAQVISLFTPNFNDTTPFRNKGITTLSSIPISMPRTFLECVHNINERIPKQCLIEGTNTYVTFLNNCFESIR